MTGVLFYTSDQIRLLPPFYQQTEVQILYLYV